MFDFDKMNLDRENPVKFDKDWGDRIPLDEFIECCESGSFIDYDGFAGEILLNGYVIYKDGWFYPSDVLKSKKQLIALQKTLGKLEVVWYNK